MNEFLDLHRVQLRPPRIDWVDGFDDLAAITRYLIEHPDFDNHYFVTDIGQNIRAVAFFNSDSLLLLTSGGEVMRERQAGR